MNSTGFWDWRALGSYPGSVAAVLLITRVVHQCFPNRLARVPEIAVAYAVAVVLLTLATKALVKTFNVWDYALIPINSVAVGITTVGGNTLFGITSPAPRQEPTKAHPVETSERGPERAE